MSYNNDLGAAIGWDDELTAEEASFALLEPGDYPFVVESVARKQFDGSAKMAPCFIEELSLNIQGFTIEHALFLNTKFLPRISEFFVAIGQARYGQKFRPNWTGLVGARGMCKVGYRTWTGKDGTERKANKVLTFYPPTADAMPATAPTAPGAGQAAAMPGWNQPQSAPAASGAAPVPPAQPTWQQARQTTMPGYPQSASPWQPGSF